MSTDPICKEATCQETTWVSGEHAYRQGTFKAENEGYCFTCAFWHERMEMADRIVIDDDGKFGFKGVGMYCLGNPAWSINGTAGLGFGGHIFMIEYFDSRETIRTNNLWYNGRVPEHFLDRIKVNARFI